MMRLRRLDLTRFGHFNDHSIDLGPAVPGASDFHIIYGPNEAGKTTLMEAYLRLIYGFPMRDSYGFKHPLNTLQVGGLVEIGGAGTELVRVKKTANSLLDQHGDAIPETQLHACLGGIGQDDYRKLFCLDDATIEAGGDEITNSKGDIGRLLFAAAAGIGDLTGALDQVAARADSFYKKGASKTTFAGLKRELDATTAGIKEVDVSASLYRGLRTTLDAAKVSEAAARLAKATAERRKSELSALIAAHPIATDLRDAEAALLPFAHYPQTLDIDPESLVEMIKTRVALESKCDQLAHAFQEAQSRRDALVLRPDVLELGTDILTLEGMLGRMEGALADLPIRTAERAEELAKMRAKLMEMGLAPGDDPTRFVLPEHRLLSLERLAQNWREAEASHATANAEHRKASVAQDISAAQLAAAETAVTIGPEVSEILTRFDATRCVDDNRAALHRLGLAEITAVQRLRDLARDTVTFATLPVPAVSQRQAEGLVIDTLKAQQHLETLGNTCASAADKFARAQARLRILVAAPDLVTDDLARTSRAARDANWVRHRAALSAETADLFLRSMQHDDNATALRQAQTREIAEYHQALMAEAEAAAEHQTALTALHAAQVTQAGLTETLTRHLATLGLRPDLSAADLADWLRQHAAALVARNDLNAVQDATATARRDAAALHHALAAVPGMPEADLDTLFRIARGRSETRAAQLAEVKAKRDAHDRIAADLALRHAVLRDARTASTAAATLWQTEASTALSAETPLEHLRDGLQGLRSLREINETIGGLTRQITSMARDRDMFTGRATALAAHRFIRAGQSPLDTYRSARTDLTEAELALTDWQALTTAMEVAQAAENSARLALEIQDAQTRKLAEIFAANIPVATLQDLRSAVAQGKRAIDLRSAIAKCTTSLVARLGVDNRAAAEAALSAQPFDAAEAELAALAEQTPRLTQAYESAIADRSAAQSALDRVQGDADVARRTALLRTIEMDMQEGTLRYLEDRFAHLLAERAIRRYRDTHRGGMLVATETAFRILTNAAYATLSTRPEGASETLVAIQTADGSAKQAHEMSKGTRFQLYLALRAAAYEQVAAGGTILPFFCDDIFETFDESRTRAACGLMHQIGQRGQAIYLTHHKHVVDIARDLCGAGVRIHNLVA